jgi:hypothetical protein
MYFHEWFGYTIYTPLTEGEQEAMRKDPSNVPNWMNEFTSLPNIAIPLSYFCIGIALQLLRTPLIVYFIEDQNATPAEVNVLFTVSKSDIGSFLCGKPSDSSVHSTIQWLFHGASRLYMAFYPIAFLFLACDVSLTLWPDG